MHAAKRYACRPMPEIAYTVTATLPDEQTEQAYLRWLREGHVRAVINAGASSGLIVSLDDPAGSRRVQARYLFPSRDALDDYVRERAAALRADGLRLFPPESGISFERETGVVQ